MATGIVPWIGVGALLFAVGLAVRVKSSAPAPPPATAEAAPTRSTAPPAGIDAAPDGEGIALPPLPALPPPETPPVAAVAAPELPPESCPLSSAGYGTLLPTSSRPSGRWYTRAAEWNEARREQEQSGAPLVVYVYTDWCGYCRAFERDLLDTPAVDGWMRDEVVRIRIDPEGGPDEQALSRQLGVTGFPTFMVAADDAAPQRLSIYGGPGVLKTPAELIAAIEERAASMAPALWRRGRAAREAGRTREAVELLTRALRLRPESVELWVERAIASSLDGDRPRAIDDLAHAARLEPRNVLPYRAVEHILATEGRWAEAAACWALLQRSDPESGDAAAGRRRSLERAAPPT